MGWPPPGVHDIDLVSMVATPVLGRGDDLQRVTELVATDALVCLTGPGGVGKTRLALEVASRLHDHFADGVAWVTFTGIDDAVQVPSAISTVLQIPLGQNETLTDAVTASLRSQHRLLVLDNCEHVLGGAADLCVAIGASCPDVRILATSRERLGLPHEALYPVAPLAVPTPDETLLRAWCRPSVALFTSRARQINPGFADVPNEHTQSLVCNIVRLLDGLPLAITLAAAQLDVLDLAELEARLTDDPDRTPNAWPTTQPPPSLHARHATLEACVQWSYEHLDPQAQTGFTRLAAFPGRFSLEAARAVGAEPDLVTNLARKSLLTGPQRDPDGTLRYGMLSTIKAVALRLAKDKLGADQARMDLASWYAFEVERVAAEFDSASTELPTLAWFDAEYDNLRAMIRWAARHEPVLALRLAVGTSQWALIRGRSREASALLARLIRGANAAWQVEPREHDPGVLTEAQVWLGWFALFVNDFAACKRIHENLTATPGLDERLLVDSLNCVAGAHLNTGDLDAGEAAALEARDRAASVGYTSGESFSFVVLSVLELYRDNGAGALNWAEAAMAANRRNVTGWVHRWRLHLLGDALQITGDRQGASAAYDELLTRSQAAGHAHLAATASVRLGNLQIRAGQLDGRDHVRAALEGFATIRDPLMITDVFDATAYYGLGIGHPDAPVLIGVHEATMRRIGAPETPTSARVLQELLDSSTRNHKRKELEAAVRRGARLDLDDAIDLAREVLTFESPARTAAGCSFPLSAREREIVQLVADGLTDAQIAAQLFISLRTVRSHLDRIGAKTGHRRRAELTRLALQGS